jgi:hypothetical protein
MSGMVSRETGAPRQPRSWFRFSLRALLVCITMFAVWLGWQMHRRREQMRVVAAMTARGGTVGLMIPDLSWRSRVQIYDQDLNILEAAPQVRTLHIADNHVTDEGLATLRNRTELLALDLTNNPAVTDKGLSHLAKLTNLELLNLRKNPQITDEGLVHLENMKNLQTLILFGTSATPAGVQKLKAKLPKTKIGY